MKFTIIFLKNATYDALYLLNLLLLAYILKTMMTPHEKQDTELGSWFSPLIIIGSLVLIIFIFVSANKLNAKQ